MTNDKLKLHSAVEIWTEFMKSLNVKEVANFLNIPITEVRAVINGDVFPFLHRHFFK